MYRTLTRLGDWATAKSFDVLKKLDKRDRHFADRKWSNTWGDKRIPRGKPQSGMMKPYAEKRWPDFYEHPRKR